MLAMNAPMSSSHFDLWMVAGWTMIHFVWLGTFVALAALMSRWLLRRTSATVRYAVALACLAMLAAMPIAIAMWLHEYSPSVRIADQPPQNDAAGQLVELKNTGLKTPTTLPAVTKGGAPIILQPVQQATPLPDATIASATPAIAAPSPADPLSLTISAINRSVQYLPWLWLIGTPLTFAFTATGLIGTRRLRRASHPITDGPIADTLAQLATSLRLTRRVVVAVCDRIAAPVLIGILRPIILLPPAALTGYSPEEIEMVLLHELAHVRRWDNLVNLLQRVVESLLFFHPAVWLISSWVRREREGCCDALVVARTDHPHAYAELLVALAAQMPRSVLFHPVASSAMAAGPLRSRIRRILQLDDDPMLISGKSFAAVLAALLLAATLAILYVPTTGHAEQSATEATEATETQQKTKHDPSIPESVSQDRVHQAETNNNLKNLALALLNYNDSHKVLPAHANYDPTGKPLLSWRVLILPQLGEEAFYKEFHLNEPWDSEHNRKLIARMPKVFKNPKLNQADMTNYLAVVGKECVFNGSPKGLPIAAIADGTAHTIALVEANESVPWTKPQDWNFDRKRPTAGLGSLWKDHWYAAFVDGSIHFENSEPPDAVGIQFTRAGGETRSLQESANRKMPEGVGSVPAEPGDGAGEIPVGNRRGKFPSLEDQKLADVAYKRLGLELEPIGADDLKRVKALGYEGGVNVVSGSADVQSAGDNIIPHDLLVGLHAWPTTSMKDVAQILNRDDLTELNPLKFYVVRYGQKIDPNNREKLIDCDVVATGRVSVQIANGFGGGGPSHDVVDSGRITINEANPSQTQPTFSTKPRPSVAVESASPEEIDILRERAKIAEDQFKTNDEQYKTGGRGGSKDRREVAAYELAFAQANLLMAEGKRGEALAKLIECQALAEEAYKAVMASYDAGRVSYDFLRTESNRLSEIKLKVARLKGEKSATGSIPSPGSASSSSAIASAPTTGQFIYAPIDGVIKKVNVKHGEVVHRNDLLLELESLDLNKEIETGRGQLQSSAKKLGSVARELDRSAGLSDADKRKKEGEIAQLKQEVKDLQKNLEMLNAKKGMLQIKSPIDGRVVTSNVQERLASRPVNRGEALLEIAKIQPVQDEQGNASVSVAGAKQTAIAPVAPSTVVVPNVEQVKVADHFVDSAAAKSEPHPSEGQRAPVAVVRRHSTQSAPVETVFVAYDIPADIKDKVLRYFGTFQSEVHTMADDRGRFIVQASQPWHDNFAALLNATPKWSDPAAAKERAAAPVVVKKVGDEDILEWRSVGLSLNRNTEANWPLSKTGVAVAEVAPGSPAAWADIRPGDVLTDVGNFHAGNMPEVQSLLKALGEGLQSKKQVRVRFVRSDSQRMAYVDAEFALGPEDLGTKSAESERSKPSVTTLSRPAASDQANFRYEGKTFKELRNAWQTELSTEKRIAAVKALAAFGANGYGKEAAEAILEVAGQYDWKFIGDNKAVEPLQNACVEALGGTWDGMNRAVAPSIPTTDSLPALSAAANSGNRKQKLFLTYVLSRIPGPESVGLLLTLSKDKDATIRQYALRSLPNLGSDGYNEKVSARIREAMNSDDPGDVAASISVSFPSRDKSAAFAPYTYLPEFSMWILSPHEAVRKQARNLASSLQGDDAAHVAEAALAVLKDNAKKEQHLEAIRALAALGPTAKSAVDELRPLAKSDNQPLSIAAVLALRRILGQVEYNTMLVESFGDRFGISRTRLGESVGIPDDVQKREEFRAFERAVQDEEGQLFP
jgi:beta-lactamase regulating signal transducer with metallopeptidase domain/multidrug efflux pump subunit AcrA (membrane-fusion protein)